MHSAVINKNGVKELTDIKRGLGGWMEEREGLNEYNYIILKRKCKPKGKMLHRHAHRYFC